MDIVEMSIADEFIYDRNKETDAKCFIRYKTDKKNEPLFITRPQMSRYVNKVEKTQQVFLVVKDKILLEKNKSISSKIRSIIK